MFDEQSWQERYRGTELWSGRPNPQLVAEVSDLTPGTALDAGCGEGADALWLAGRGWKVTGADFATTALTRASAHADAAGLRIDWIHADLTTWTPPARFDLVSSHFLQLPELPRNAAFARLAEAVAPGGTLLIVGHDGVLPPAGADHTHPPGMFFTAAEVVASLGDGWDIVVAESRPRAHAGPGEHGPHLRDIVVRARRAG